MKTLPFILILFLMVIVLSCGCTQRVMDNKTEPATSSPSTSMTTATIATLPPATISVPPEDPIIGSWFCYNYLPSGKIEKIWTFMENNTWTMTNTNVKSQVKKFVHGVWRKERANSYQVTPSSGAPDIFEYDITKDEFSDTYFRDTYTRIK
jgi:hypothetical protein